MWIATLSYQFWIAGIFLILVSHKSKKAMFILLILLMIISIIISLIITYSNGLSP